MMYGGILGALAEASDIKAELGISFDEALKIAAERSEARLRESEPEEANVIQFRPRER